MDVIRKYFNNDAFFFSFASNYTTNYLNSINEKPVSSLLAPVTLVLFCYYVYVYVRTFYPICVNCWFCNANFKVAFENRFEFTCIECKQFNGFKNDGSYSKIIPEQHEHKYNKSIFTELHDSPKESKNGLCHKCNIVQELKVKQLACFTPTKEKYFDKEIDLYRENLEKTFQLCSKCNLYTKKILSLQEQRYNLKSIRMNNRMFMQNVKVWPNFCSLCLSFIVFLLSSCPENYFNDWISRFENTLVVRHNFITITRSIGMASLCGILCQVYQYSRKVDILSIVVLVLWSLLFTVNNFEILIPFQPRIFVSVFIILLSAVSIIANLTKKQNIRQTSIKLEDEKCQFNTSYNEISANGSIKSSDESEMMDIDHTEMAFKKMKKTLPRNVDNLFQGMKLNENFDIRNNIIRPPKFCMSAKPDRFARYAESSPGYYTPYPMKDDYDFDTQSLYSQHSYKSQYTPLYHQSISPYTYYVPPHPLHQQPSPLNLSQSSNTSNIQQHSTEWSKMLVYTIPGIILLTLQCYLLYDIKDFMKQK